jgi:hypothetical protein
MNITKDKAEKLGLEIYDGEDLYLEFLNELESVTIAGLEYLQGDALKEVDPVAFRCGTNDYMDSMSDVYTELTNGDYVLTDELERALDNE